MRPWSAAQTLTPAPPGQYTTPIQEATTPAYRISSTGSAENYASQANLSLGNGSKAELGTIGQEKVNMWSIGREQLVAMVIGALLFAALFFLSGIFGSNYIAHTTSIALACITLLFLGTVLGPWVGLFTGVVGILIVGILQNQGIFDIAGFIAGMTLLITSGRYNNARAIATAATISIIGSFIGIYIAYFPFIGIQDLVSFSVIPSLVFLPALLTIYNALVRRGERA